jgi:hypothetical protein
MAYPLSYQMYQCERRLSPAEQRAADDRAGAAAARLRELRTRLARAFPSRHPRGRLFPSSVR